MQKLTADDQSLDLQSDQTELVAFLSRPSSYPDVKDPVERIDTHGAIVFLAGTKAYKLKRAIRLPYLDFSTIDKREAACRNELKRNAAASAQIYIDVVPVTREGDETLMIGGQGKPEDWLVVMNRFDQSDLMDNLATRNALGLPLMDPLAETIADYHARAQQVHDCDGEDIASRVITQIIDSLSYACNEFGLQSTQELSSGLVAQLNRHSKLLRMRAKAGSVRLCHGDLHLRNIVNNNGQPTLFDALEFDDGLATTDVLYDLAFLLMDLWHRNLKGHANRCFSTYASKGMSTSELSGISLLPLFMSMRASIRTLVTVDKLAVASDTPDGALLREAHEYFDLARSLLKTEKPVLVAVGGRSGTGKTTLAAALAPGLGHAPGALHLRSDIERKRMMGAPLLEKLPRQAYSSEASNNVYRRLCNRAEQALQTGHSVVVDAVFLEPIHRRWVEQIAARHGCGFLGLWLEADQDQMIERVNQRKFDASDADSDVVRQQLKVNGKSMSWSAIDARGTPNSALSQARQAVTRQL